MDTSSAELSAARMPKHVTLGVRNCREVTITAPTTPDEITGVLFNSCPENEPQAAVLQQELIIACSDLIAQKPFAFDGVLTIRLSWLADAISLMLNYMQSTGNIRKDSVIGKLNLSLSCTSSIHTSKCVEFECLASHVHGNNFVKNLISSRRPFLVFMYYMYRNCSTHCFLETDQSLSVYDLPPIVIKDVVVALLTKKYWHLLTPLQSRRLNGSLNRVPINFYDSVWKILERTQGGIVIAGRNLPQQPTLSDMTQFELTFAYKIESMLSVIGHPEYRHVLVELLCIIAIILERNCELIFSDKLDLDQLIFSAFRLYCSENGIRDMDDMTPFYELDNSDFTKNSSANYLTRVYQISILFYWYDRRLKMCISSARNFQSVVDCMLSGTLLNRRNTSTFMSGDSLRLTPMFLSERSDDQGYSSCSVS
ncbi:unnamed protein product [Thelazia callipaeda]|uniref:Phosphorylase b kinase regulatory subunit n=1 Tax=Thelazia callipaeda TaxID=103827 RepID=A0A0N5CRK4_THECL|nr:unnamed protein product [Thelazia callipaeda]